jgi:hypothetical protein
MIFVDYLVLLFISIIHISVYYWFELKMYHFFMNKLDGSQKVGYWEFIFKYLYKYEFTKLSSKMRIITPSNLFFLWGTMYVAFIPILVHNYIYRLDKFPINPQILLAIVYILAVFIIPYILYKKEIKSKKNTDSEISN